MTFKQAAQERWYRLHGTAEWAHCECGCGRSIHKDQVPHHIGTAKGGIGGQRTHDPDRLLFLADCCHSRFHGIRERGR